MSKQAKRSWLWSLRNKPFFIRLLNWEYWPIYIINIPVIFIWLYFAIRSKSLFFFSSVNPAIETGGVLGESKINILNRIPKERIPKTLFIPQNSSVEDIKKQLLASGLEFPVIAKPNVGERGLLVTKLDCEQDLETYVFKRNIDFIIQPFITLPLELSIMYYRFPDSPEGYVNSICIKKHLCVEGDGYSTVEELVKSKPRALLQYDRLKIMHREKWQTVPKNKEIIELEPIGNHCRGTMFLNGNHLIDLKITNVINQIGQQMDDIHFGRFDLKCKSIESLRKGEHFQILEFNGIASEPAHIYHPGYPILKAYRDIYSQWKIIYKISKLQYRKGIKGMTLREARIRLRDYFKYMQLLKT